MAALVILDFSGPGSAKRHRECRSARGTPVYLSLPLQGFAVLTSNLSSVPAMTKSL